MSEYSVEKNREILKGAISKLGKKRMPFKEDEIDKLAESKTFNLIDYMKKIMISNEVLDIDKDLNIEFEMKEEYEALLKERVKLEESENDLTKNKRYNNIKAKTDYGFSFYAMQSHFTPKKLNEIARNNPEVEYKIENEIDRRSRRSRHFKEDRQRAEANATVNMFREKFPKAKDSLTTNTLCLDSEGMTVSNVAAKTINNLCEKGVLSDFVLKVSTRVDMFSEMTGLKNVVGNVFKQAGNMMKYAASAAMVAFVGAEALDLMSTPMPPIADLGVKETFELFAAIDTTGLTETKEAVLSNDIVTPKGIDLEALNVNLDGTQIDSPQVNTDVAIEKEDESILNFLKNNQIEHNVVEGDTLTEIAQQQLENPTAEELNHFIAAMSEFNDLDNPNMILENEDIQIPSNDFVENFESNTFSIDLSNKKEILNQMKEVTINYGETKSELVEKLVEGAKETGLFKNQQLSNFESTLNEVIPTELKAFDSTVTDSIKESVNDLEKLKNQSKLKLR